MRGLISAGGVLAATLVLAACGSGGGGDSGGAASGGTGAGGSPARTATVSIRPVDGVGRVLVDRQGKALYTSDQEEGGRVVCDGSCTAFWQPLLAGDGTPTGAADVGRLGVIERPDGQRQVTLDGVPLYSFTEDMVGEVTGDGFSDDFAGRQFTWHAAVAEGGGGDADAAESSGGATRRGGY